MSASGLQRTAHSGLWLLCRGGRSLDTSGGAHPTAPTCLPVVGTWSSAFYSASTSLPGADSAFTTSMPVFVPAPALPALPALPAMPAPPAEDGAWSVVAPSPSDSATPTPSTPTTPAVPAPSVEASWSDTEAAASVASSHASKWTKGDCDIATADGDVLTVPSYHLQSARWVLSSLSSTH